MSNLAEAEIWAMDTTRDGPAPSKRDARLKAEKAKVAQREKRFRQMVLDRLQRGPKTAHQLAGLLDLPRGIGITSILGQLQERDEAHEIENGVWTVGPGPKRQETTMVVVDKDVLRAKVLAQIDDKFRGRMEIAGRTGGTYGEIMPVIAAMVVAGELEQEPGSTRVRLRPQGGGGKPAEVASAPRVTGAGALTTNQGSAPGLDNADADVDAGETGEGVGAPDLGASSTSEAVTEPRADAPELASVEPPNSVSDSSSVGDTSSSLDSGATAERGPSQPLSPDSVRMFLSLSGWSVARLADEMRTHRPERSRSSTQSGIHQYVRTGSGGPEFKAALALATRTILPSPAPAAELQPEVDRPVDGDAGSPGVPAPQASLVESPGASPSASGDGEGPVCDDTSPPSLVNASSQASPPPSPSTSPAATSVPPSPASVGGLGGPMTLGWHAISLPDRLRPTAFGPKPLTPTSLRVLDLLWTLGPLPTTRIRRAIPALTRGSKQLHDLRLRGFVAREAGEWALTTKGFLRLEAGQ